MSKKLILSTALSITLLTCLPAYSQLNTSPGETHHRTAEMDVNLGILSKKKADVQIRIPTQQAYGFEGKAITPEQEEKVNSVIDKLKQNVSQLVSVGNGCNYIVAGVDKFASATEKSGEYKKGEMKQTKTEYWVLQADIDISCNKNLKKQKMTVGFEKIFNDIDRVSVKLDGSQKREFIINKPNGEFTL
jgi:Protein of unknown function (DUF2796)